MSAAALKPPKPCSRLARFATLQRLATVLTWVFWLNAVLTVLQLIRALTRTGNPGILVPKSQPLAKLCLATGPALLQHAGSGLSHPGLAPGVHITWSTVFLCTAHPTAGQALAFTVTLLPVDVFLVGALYLVMQLARAAARDGIYTAQAARLVLIVGWWLLAGGLVATAAQAFARVNLLAHLVTWHVDWGQWPAAWYWQSPVLLIGLGLIIFSRIMRVSAGMHADLEGTV
jgi:hypothetical protein